MNPQPFGVSPLLSIRKTVKRFGARRVLDGVSLDVAFGEFLTILGESGSGKTTLLRLVAGFESLDGGEIWMGGERLDQVPAYRRPVNTVFQSYAIFPHLTVFENVAYGLRAKGVAKSEIPPRVKRALEMVQMGEFVASAPSRLSGGQQQRVAVARALVNRPKILLLDEPLSALDANLRKQMQVELKTLQREVGITFIFVTHDQDEAMALSDRVALLHQGLVEQVADPRTIYQKPATGYVAQFIGQSNLLRVRAQDGTACAGSISWSVHGEWNEATFSLRPECIGLADSSRGRGRDANSSPPIRFRGRVTRQTFGGASDLLEIDCGNSQRLRARIASPGLLEGEREFEFFESDLAMVRDSAVN